MKLELVIAVCLLLILNATVLPCGAQSSGTTSQVDTMLAMGKTPSAVTKPLTTVRHWSTRKKIIVGLVAACVVATAIAVPVSVHAHEVHKRHEAARKALTNLIVANNQQAASLQQQQLTNQIAADIKQEQAIQTLMSQPNVSQQQIVNFQRQLTTLKTTVSGLQSQLNVSVVNSFVAAQAFETSFAATVPPPLVAANRSQLAQLTATNFFGQNTPAITAAESQYQQMWAQDVAAMHGYHP